MLVRTRKPSYSRVPTELKNALKQLYFRRANDFCHIITSTSPIYTIRTMRPIKRLAKLYRQAKRARIGTLKMQDRKMQGWRMQD